MHLMQRQRADGWLSGRRIWIAIILILLLGLLLRVHHYQTAPPHSWTADEFAFAWCGMSLLQDGVPTAWSWLDVYGKVQITFWEDGRHYRMVTPWLDHPPLFALLPGAAALLGGESDSFAVTLTWIRLPSILLGTLSIFLLFLLARDLFGNLAAILSTLIMATAPGLVFLNRLAVSENLIVVLLLASLLLLRRYRTSGKHIFLYTAAVVAGLASLAKITGFFVVLLLALLLLNDQRRRQALEVLVIGSLVASLYLVYGMLLDPKLFWSLLLEHGGRFRNFDFLQELLFHRDMLFFDPWFIFGWLVLIPVVRDLDRHRHRMLLVLPPLVYLATLLFTGAQGHFFAWYTIPFFPFLALAAGLFFTRLLDKPDFTGAALAIIFVGLWCFSHLLVDTKWSMLAHFLPAGTLRFLAIPLLALAAWPYYSLHRRNPTDQHAKLAGAMTVVILSFSLLANISMVLNFPAVYGR